MPGVAHLSLQLCKMFKTLKGLNNYFSFIIISRYIEPSLRISAGTEAPQVICLLKAYFMCCFFYNPFKKDGWSLLTCLKSVLRSFELFTRCLHGLTQC